MQKMLLITARVTARRTVFYYIYFKRQVKMKGWMKRK